MLLRVAKLFVCSFQVFAFSDAVYTHHIPSKCKIIGGEIFVTKKQDDLKKIESLSSINYTFTGICQNDHGQWESLTDNKLIDFDNWSLQPPEDTSGERQCLLYDMNNEKLVGLSPTNFPIICKMPNKPVEFFLRGVCPGLQVDTYFVLKSPFVLLGYIYSSIIYDYSRQGWKIISNTNNKTFAFLPYKHYFPPIGHQLWVFNDSNCFDEGGNKTRTLFLHLAVDQPGHFCCNNGACIEPLFVMGPLIVMNRRMKKTAKMLLCHKHTTQRDPLQSFPQLMERKYIKNQILVWK